MVLSARTYRSTSTRNPPLIVLHGLLGTADNWHTVSRNLSASFDVHALDLRNHGASPHAEDMSYDLMADDVIEYMDVHGIERAHFIGHSLGGKVAMVLALSYGERVRGLVVEDMTPFRTSDRNREYVELLLSLPLDRAANRKDAEGFLAENVGSRSMVLFLLKNLTRGDDGSYRWRPNLQGILDNYDRLWEGIDEGQSWAGPTLFITGGRSDYLDPNDHARVKTMFPNAGFYEIEGAGHWVHAEATAEFCAYVRGFLENA